MKKSRNAKLLPQEQKLKKIIIVSCGLLLVVTFYLHARLIVINAPIELRESATVLTTSALLKGINPFSLEHTPEFINVHGILYNLVVYPFAAFFGSTFLLHRNVSAFFIFASTVLIYLAILKESHSSWLAFTASVFIYSQIVIGTPIGMSGGFDVVSRPDSLGMFLFLASLLIPYWLKFSNRGLIVGLTLGILAFFAKPYFILGLVFLGIYLFLFNAKKTGLIFSLGGVALFIFVACIVQYYFETYFFNVVLIHHGIRSWSFPHLISQIKTIVVWNGAPLAVLILWLTQKKAARVKIDYFSSALVFFTIITVTLFGPHMGNAMSYFTHLITPFLLIWVFSNIQNPLFNKDRLFLYFLIIVNVGIVGFAATSYYPKTQINKAEWKWWEQRLKKSEKIFNSSATAHIVFEQNKQLYDNGHSEYLKYGLETNDKLMLVPSARAKLEAYTTDIQGKIHSQFFDLVIIGENSFPVFSRQELAKTYQLEDTRRITMYKQSWLEELWIPRIDTEEVSEK